MEYLAHILVIVSLYAILAASFNLLIGWAGLFALSQAAFFGVGAYAVALLTTKLGLGFPLPLFAGVIVAALVGMLVALPALRIGGDHLVIVTLALQIIVIAIMVNWRSLTGGTDGIPHIPKIVILGAALDTAGKFLPLAASVAALALGAAWILVRSPFARAVRAMRENEAATLAIGKNVVALKLTVFAFSAGLAAVAGGLYAQYLSYVSSDAFTLDVTINVLAMVILGGTGNLWGSVLGAALLTMLPEALNFITLPPDIADKSREILYGAALIAILAWRPQGLIPEPAGRHRARGRIATRSFLEEIGPADGMVWVKASGLMRRFGGIIAVDGLDLELRRGRITGLIGPNGAGKTTSFNLLTGFLRSDGGVIEVGGTVLGPAAPHRIVRAGLARSFQDLRLFTRMSVLDNVRVALPGQRGDHLRYVFFAPFRVAREEAENAARAMDILDFVGLSHRALDRAEDLSYA
ncbi:MAG TPA: ATP-binding cassette domain-containing protein, partial [Stellaceae bacterium]|nr:ATP-binding cassette domain-containing protein [Stellaceae bacterium]